VSRIGVSTHVRLWRLRDRRPGHPSHRTLRGNWSIGSSPRAGHAAAAPAAHHWSPTLNWSAWQSPRCCCATTTKHHWLPAAASRVGHLFPRLLRQSEYHQRLKTAAPRVPAGSMRRVAGRRRRWVPTSIGSCVVHRMSCRSRGRRIEGCVSRSSSRLWIRRRVRWCPPAGGLCRSPVGWSFSG
jgi:hypothetical protein